jgi:hypothetical protein
MQRYIISVHGSIVTIRSNPVSVIQFQFSAMPDATVAPPRA